MTDKEKKEVLTTALGQWIDGMMEDAEGYKAYKKKLEDAKNLSRRMMDALFSDEGKATLRYLKELRGYDEDFIRKAKFGHVSDGLANDIFICIWSHRICKWFHTITS